MVGLAWNSETFTSAGQGVVNRSSSFHPGAFALHNQIDLSGEARDARWNSSLLLSSLLSSCSRHNFSRKLILISIFFSHAWLFSPEIPVWMSAFDL